MRSVTVRTADLKNIIINLGFVGENEHRQIRFDAKKDFEEYPNASASLTVAPPEGESYPAIIERDGDYVLWTITDSDVIGEGDGEIQLAFTEGEVVKRTCIARTKTDRSLVQTGSIPSGLDDFIVRAGALLEQVEETFPAGGTTGQVLAKKSDEDYDTEWVPQGTAEDLIDDTAGDGDTDKTWSADKLHDEFNGKANKYNTVLTSTLSRGRREGSSVGKGSYAFGNSVVASGENSHAEGLMSTASGENSHAEGHGTHATNARTHAEGYSTYANGANAHSEGYATQANGPHSHAEGSNTTASHKSQHVFGEFNIADDSSASATNRGNYVEIVGNGTGPNTKSNARTLDWDGNEELAGDLTIKKGTANEVKVSELYKKPATGIPASDLEDGVIPDPEDLIDDEAGEGDTDKVWSADKSHSLLTEINSRYTKPNTGIPATDMASSVQTSLNNADSAYQKPQTGIPATDMAEGVIPDISGKADKTVTDTLQKNKAPVIIDSAEGNPIVLTDGADGLPVEGMKIHFLPKQDTSGGDPSPSNVCPISGWTGITTWRTGANLFDEQWTQGNIQEGQETPSTSVMRTGFINVHPSTSYYCYTERTVNVFIFEYDGEGNYLNRVKNIATGNVFTTGDGTGKIRIVDRNSGTEAVDTGINYPSTVTTYAPYTGNSYPVTFPETVYGGTLDAVNGVLTVDLAYDQMTYSYLSGLSSSYIGYGQQTWDGATRNVVWVRNWNYKTAKARQSGGIEAYCNAFKVSMHETGFIGSQNRVYFDVGSMISVEDFLSAVQALETNGGGLFVCYELATPIEIPLDPITVQTLIGDNTIWSDANGTIELDYRADTKLFIAKQKTDIRATIAPIEDGTTASQAYSAGKFFYHDGNFCKAKTSIASGATFTLNTNYEITNVADELFALN